MSIKTLIKKRPYRKTIKETWPYHLMIFPGMLILFIYTILPFFGNVMAFQNFIPTLGFFNSPWVGLDHFRFMAILPEVSRVFFNSLIIATGRLVFTMVFSILFAVLLFEARGRHIKKWVQSICFFPFFLSWVILANVFRNVLDETGVVNTGLMAIGLLENPIIFLGNNTTFRPIVIATAVWRDYGYGAIIFIAALTAINQELFEAADIDGAGRLRKIWNITLPGIRTAIVLVATLNLAQILNAGFDQIFNLYSPVVFQTGDIIDTYVVRMSFISNQFSFAAAVGLLRSIISLFLIIASYTMARKFAGYRIF